MHMHRDPQTMQTAPMEGDVVPQVLSFWEQHAQALRALRVDSARIVLDPGIGFGKTVAQNFALLARQQRVARPPAIRCWWAGRASRRSAPSPASRRRRERMVPSVAAALLAVERGARIVRVHDVRETVAALAVWRAMKDAEQQAQENNTT